MMEKLKHTPGPFEFRPLTGKDNRGMGYIEANGLDIAHSGESSLWAEENLANAELFRLSFTAPHSCFDPTCPGQQLVDLLVEVQDRLNVSDPLVKKIRAIIKGVEK